jgi:hypothetical protein
LDDLGELPSGGEWGRDFDGGQCSTTYLVSLQNYSTVVPFPATAQAFVTGPVGGTYKLGPIEGGFYNWFVEGNPNMMFRVADEGEKWAVSSVQRFDGGNDNCGNTAPGYKPTDYLPDDGGGREPIEGPGGLPFGIDINPDGGIDIDFPGFDGPGRTIDEPFLPPKPEDYGPDSTPPEVPGDRGVPDAPEEVGEGGDAEGEDEDRILVGVKVTLTTIAPKARITYQGGKAFYSYAYSVMMGGDGGVERDNESAFCTAVAFYHAPENSNRFSVAFRKGFAGNVVPYWRTPE